MVGITDERSVALGEHLIMADHYYTINLRHASIGEIWRYCSSLRERARCIGKKLLGLDVFTGACLPDGRTLRFWPADARPEQIPDAIREQLAGCARALTFHGYYSFAGVYRVLGYGAVFLAPDRRFWAQLAWSWSCNDAQLVGAPAFACTSAMATGGLLTTTNIPRTLVPPPDFDAEHCSHAAVAQIIRRHEARLGPIAPERISRIGDPADAIRDVVDRKIEYHRSKGILVELDLDELRRMDDSPCTIDHGFSRNAIARP